MALQAAAQECGQRSDRAGAERQHLSADAARLVATDPLNFRARVPGTNDPAQFSRAKIVARCAECNWSMNGNSPPRGPDDRAANSARKSSTPFSRFLQFTKQVHRSLRIGRPPQLAV